VAPPVPASTYTDFGGDSTGGLELPTIQGVAFGGNELAVISALVARGGRLLILNEADRRSVPLRKATMVIGRSRKVDCTIKNGGVSNEHLRLSFRIEDAGFLVEDLGSQNGSVVNRVPLRQGNPQPLDSESHLRIGSVEAIMRCAVDSHGTPIGPEFDQRVAAELIKSGALKKSALKNALRVQKESKQPLGDTLLLEGRITPEQWTVQARRALQDLERRNAPRLGLIFLVVLFVILVLGAILMQTGNLSFSNSTLP
jgi:pSer/pThr/pTyr-binding forkhead associated (FHA) protein